MDATFSQTIPHRGETLTARIMKMPDGGHAAEITSSAGDTEDAVLWSRVFHTESIATITGTLVRQWDYFMACRTGGDPGSRPRD
jgi:hypothetical protein